MTTGTTNPYQEVIDWLRSPEGEQWSERRLEIARIAACTLVTYSARGVAFYDGGLAGVFSFKPQSFYTTEESFEEYASGQGRQDRGIRQWLGTTGSSR